MEEMQKPVPVKLIGLDRKLVDRYINFLNRTYEERMNELNDKIEACSSEQSRLIRELTDLKSDSPADEEAERFMKFARKMTGDIVNIIRKYASEEVRDMEYNKLEREAIIDVKLAKTIDEINNSKKMLKDIVMSLRSNIKADEEIHSCHGTEEAATEIFLQDMKALDLGDADENTISFEEHEYNEDPIIPRINLSCEPDDTDRDSCIGVTAGKPLSFWDIAFEGEEGLSFGNILKIEFSNKKPGFDPVGKCSQTDMIEQTEGIPIENEEKAGDEPLLISKTDEEEEKETARIIPMEAHQGSTAVANEIKMLRHKYILGKIAGEDLFDSQGKTIIEKNALITPIVIDTAEKEGKLSELIVNMLLPDLGE